MCFYAEEGGGWEGVGEDLETEFGGEPLVEGEGLEVESWGGGGLFLGVV